MKRKLGPAWASEEQELWSCLFYYGKTQNDKKYPSANVEMQIELEAANLQVQNVNELEFELSKM